MSTVIENPKAYRLPSYALPRRYDIDIDARLGREEFHGKVAIQLEINERQDSIELHQNGLKLSNARLSVGGRILEGKIEHDNEREMAEIAFNEPLPLGAATLEISFDGKLSRSMEGLYLAKDGPEQALCTQCEETDARRIFPCFDEPTFKAQFAWKVTTSPDVTVLANGPLVETSMSNDSTSKTWTFEATKPMSSYLIALVIGDIAGTPEEVVNGTLIRVWALRGKEQMGEFAHKFTKRLLPWYEDYFATPYHFDKYDQAAVPGFAAGAMENSGLVTFRQSALIMNPSTSSWQAEKRIAHVVAHEFAHMWFGDLVTMKWWDDLWLNEAFAEWVSTKAVDALEPGYEMWNDFQNSKNGAFAADSLESTHPIYSPVETPAQASELFDVITYEKGCSVLRMLENFLGEEDFRAGLRTYMKEFAESNAAGSDLWRHLQGASEQPVTAIMESWISQGGYPVVRAELQGNNRLQLKQKRFYSTPKVSSDTNQQWHIPLVVRYEDSTGIHETRALMDGREMSMDLDVKGDLKWCYINADEIGFYRQHLDDAIMGKLLANLDKLTPLEQSGLLGDQWALVRNGSQSINRFLDVLAALSASDNYTVTEQVVGRLHAIEGLLEDAKDDVALQKFRVWVGNTFREQLNSLGFEVREGESQNDTQRRGDLIDAMSTLAHDPEAIAQTIKWADREAADPASVDANLAGTLVAAAAKFGDANRFDRYVKIYEQRRAASASPQETNRYLYSFTAFEQPELVSRVLKMMDDKVVPQEAMGPLLREMLPQRHTQVRAWEYFMKNWDNLRATLGDQWMTYLVEATGQLLPDKRDEMVSFFDKNLKGLAEKSYARALEIQAQLAELRSRTRDDLIGWFDNI